ncbi:unnamed protein product [Phyllotreta striolata]|uniref:Uncharacterized protein n=1 Tax=Phyllotreta striolata TaxID=444603 RepID=A0A9N9XU09_PHYSR|nr:unnamed protein product [Phyllotreta striolata]
MSSTADLVQEPRPSARPTPAQRLLYAREVITVEPVIGAYMLASQLCVPAIFNLEFEKSCRSNLAFGDAVCEAVLAGDVANITDQNNRVQVVINDVHSWQLPLQTVVPIVLILFLGSFSDRHSWRKPFLIMPFVGELISVAGCILSVVFMVDWTLEVQGMFQVIIPSLFGGQPMITMAIFAYIADVSSLEMRTLRIGVVQIVISIIVPLSQSFSAHLFELIGYYGVFLTAGAIYAFGIAYAAFWIKEPHKPRLGSIGETVRDMFDPRHAIDTFNLVLRKQPGVNRLYLVLMLAVVLIYSMVADGENGLFFLYTQHQFGWTVIELTYFSTVNTLIHLVGTALAVPFFTKVLYLSDMMILFLTFVDKIAANFIFGFANSVSLLYTAAAVTLITGVTPIGMRSFQTKIVSENDLGKAQSLFGVFEALAPAIASPVYNKLIYNNTITSFPAAFFFFSILLYAVGSILIMRIYATEKLKNRGISEEKGVDNNGKQIPMDNIIEVTHM